MTSFDVTWRHLTSCDVIQQQSIMTKGLLGEGTLQHRSREVCQRSGVFIPLYFLFIFIVLYLPMSMRFSLWKGKCPLYVLFLSVCVLRLAVTQWNWATTPHFYWMKYSKIMTKGLGQDLEVLNMHNSHLTQSSESCCAETDLRIFVIAIPKEGLAAL